jgi:acetyl-CoA carboxylase biotin carboxyl carrier protein
LVKDADLSELEIERGNMRLKIVNHGRDCAAGSHVGNVQFSGISVPTIIRDDKVSQIVATDDGANYHIIKSPVVGTFYSAQAPEAPDFVSMGVPVDINSTVCIIEAMKVMNEIQAEVKGVIAEIFVRNGQAVEFGQPLFKVKKL